MKTTREEKERFIAAGSAIAHELRELGPRIIVDCGACDGLDSIIYARMFPQATIYAVEARADNYLELRDNIQQFDCQNVKAINACLSDVHGESKFWSSFGDSGNRFGWETGNKSSSILRPTGHVTEHRWCHFKEERVKTLRFDELGVGCVDFLHLDVQGAEVKVLSGFGEVLNSLRMVWVEVAKRELYHGQPLIGDVEAFMKEHGFVKVKDTCTNKYGDQLWKRS